MQKIIFYYIKIFTEVPALTLKSSPVKDTHAATNANTAWLDKHLKGPNIYYSKLTTELAIHK